MSIRKKIIVAYDQNHAIGGNNGLLWHNPEDMRRFRRLTDGNAIIFGRKTVEAVRLLPNRYILGVSRDHALVRGVSMVGSLEDAYQLAEEAGFSEVFIGGGQQIYEKALSDADEILATEIHAAHDDADTFFPEIEGSEWRETRRLRRLGADGLSLYDFVRYVRK